MKKTILTLILITVFAVSGAYAMNDPSEVYCSGLGYEFIVKETIEGQTGFCKMPDGKEISSWNFLLGKEGKEYSYCEKEGYGMRTILSTSKCSVVFSRECAVCILPDNSEVEVTRLMNLSFKEGVCGDGICAVDENYDVCPDDCKSGRLDGYCDKMDDGKCDPDCDFLSDTDCKGHTAPKEKIECLTGDGVCYCECLGKDGDCEVNGSLSECITEPESGLYREENRLDENVVIKDHTTQTITIILMIILAFVIIWTFKKK